MSRLLVQPLGGAKTQPFSLSFFSFPCLHDSPTLKHHYRDIHASYELLFRTIMLLNYRRTTEADISNPHVLYCGHALSLNNHGGQCSRRRWSIVGSCPICTVAPTRWGDFFFAGDFHISPLFHYANWCIQSGILAVTCLLMQRKISKLTIWKICSFIQL